MTSDHLRIGFNLPFPVTLLVGRAGWPLTVEMEYGASGDQTTAPLLANCAQSFVQGALYGLGGSETITPRLHDARDVEPSMAVREDAAKHRSVTVSAPVDAIDIRYVTVLLHKLYALSVDGVPVTRVAVDVPSGAETGHPVRVEPSAEPEFPGRWRSEGISIESNLDTYASSRLVDVTFLSEPSAQAISILDRGCQLWASQCIEGGYTSATYDLGTYSLVPGRPRTWGVHYEWNLDKAFVDPGAFDGLTNVLQAFSHSVWPLSRLTIT